MLSSEESSRDLAKRTHSEQEPITHSQEDALCCIQEPVTLPCELLLVLPQGTMWPVLSTKNQP